MFLAALGSPARCHAANIVFVRSEAASPQKPQELEVAAQFYGLGITAITAGATHDRDLALTSAIAQNETVAVAIAADALAHLDEQRLLRSLRRGQGDSVPLLILGVTPDTDPTLLRAWSGGATVACQRLQSPLHLRYAIGRVEGVSGQLSDLEIPFEGAEAFYFVRPEHGTGREIINARDDRHEVPVFIEAALDRQRVFLECARPSSAQAGAIRPEGDVVSAFASVAPAMLFVKYCAGERGWHTLDHYANFTIDDPSLREPYGLLNYGALLAEMERHNFHTTIAFIPWNYDRSEPAVVSLFRRYPGRFSVSIHGDNHDHKEFTDYRSKPLDGQVTALRQSLARMERFRALTGVPYDRVMIFPHSIAPRETFEALKSHDYLATVNSTDVPMGSLRPQDPLFAMRCVTLLFGGFPSMIRHSVEDPIPPSVVAVDAFLDNPFLFYGHHQFFRNGIGAFDNIADQVNRLEPHTLWRGLGEIVRHYYLVKLRDDSNYDVLALSGTLNLENRTGRDALFYVRKMESSNPAIESVNVDGQSWPFQLRGGYLEFRLPIPSGQARGIAVHYERGSVETAVGVQKSSLRVYLLREVSEFRDDFLWGSAVGRRFVRWYYEDRQSLLVRLSLAGLLLLSCIWMAWRIRIVFRRRTSA